MSKTIELDNKLFDNVYHNREVVDYYANNKHVRKFANQALKDAIADGNAILTQLEQYKQSEQLILVSLHNLILDIYDVSKSTTLKIESINNYIDQIYKMSYELLISDISVKMFDDVVKTGENMLKLLNENKVEDNILNDKTKERLTLSLKRINIARQLRTTIGYRSVVRSMLTTIYEILTSSFRYEQFRMNNIFDKIIHEANLMLSVDKYNKDALNAVLILANEGLKLTDKNKMVDNFIIQQTYVIQNQIKNITIQHLLPPEQTTSSEQVIDQTIVDQVVNEPVENDLA